MTFDDIIAALSKEMGAEIETEGGFCAIRTSGVADEQHTLANHPELFTLADKTIAQG